MPNTTQRLLDLVSEANANCSSDYRIGKLLGVSTSAVSRWRTGVGHMSQGNVVAACKVAGIRDAWRWIVFVGSEREQGPDGDFYREVREDFEALERGGKAKKGGYLHMLIHGLPKNVASVLLGTALALGLAALPAQRVAAAPSEGGTPGMYIKLTRRWMVRRWLLRWLGISIPGRIVTAPAF
jgi:hypothetical protein